MIIEYTKIFEKSLKGVDTSLVPGKYLNATKNYRRISRPIIKAKKSCLTKGLDFGCGSVGSCIIGKLYNIEIVGLDIPYGLDDSVEGERTRGGIQESEMKDKKSIHLDIQNQQKKMGYKIIIRDTNVYPWKEFSNNEFDFIMAYFALSKEWIQHSDTLNFDSNTFAKRIKELIRVTRKGGIWYVYPMNHIKSMQKYYKLFLKKKIIIQGWG